MCRSPLRTASAHVMMSSKHSYLAQYWPHVSEFMIGKMSDKLATLSWRFRPETAKCGWVRSTALLFICSQWLLAVCCYSYILYCHTARCLGWRRSTHTWSIFTTVVDNNEPWPKGKQYSNRTNSWSYKFFCTIGNCKYSTNIWANISLPSHNQKPSKTKASIFSYLESRSKSWPSG